MPLDSPSPDALTFIRDHQRAMSRAIETLQRAAGSADQIEVEHLASDAVVRLDVQEELDEQVLYPSAAARNARLDGCVERIKLLHALSRVLLDDLRLEASDPHWSRMLADEIGSVFDRYAAEHAALLETLERGAAENPASDGGLARRLAELRDRLLAVTAPPTLEQGQPA